MNQLNKENLSNKHEEMSLRDISRGLILFINYLLSKWLIIVFWCILGMAIGFLYSIYRKPVYNAVCTFVLEDGNKGSGLGQYAGLASLAGIDIMGGGGNGIFQGDNILQLYKSRTMIQQTLLSPVNFGKGNQLLIDRYIDYNQLRDKWRKMDNIDSIAFTGDPDKFNRKQDSIIQDLVNVFNQKILNVSKPDKKLSIINVQVSSTDEIFAKEFNNKLVENVNNFYTQTKTKKSNQNVKILQKQADSVKAVLNSSISGVASAIDAAPNANPGLISLRVPSQKKQVDVQASTAIYTEIVKNLEISKMSLRQETPLVQVIDKPILPLSIDRVSKFKGTILGGIIVGMMTIFIFISIKLYKDFIKNG